MVKVQAVEHKIKVGKHHLLRPRLVARVKGQCERVAKYHHVNNEIEPCAGDDIETESHKAVTVGCSQLLPRQITVRL